MVAASTSRLIIAGKRRSSTGRGQPETFEILDKVKAKLLEDRRNQTNEKDLSEKFSAKGDRGRSESKVVDVILESSEPQRD